MVSRNRINPLQLFIDPQPDLMDTRNKWIITNIVIYGFIRGRLCSSCHISRNNDNQTILIFLHDVVKIQGNLHSLKKIIIMRG
ncbi:MAG: hypothetical protein A2Y86_06750 [Candidatus Aminicenantes bacterium RBG_13_62_12]|nr:MAG: hypothetical protein A2Y86_06750 [Candidatus Aminicenantes bacterium RBG_13_62_12]